jgi:hypothetical protein
MEVGAVEAGSKIETGVGVGAEIDDAAGVAARRPDGVKAKRFIGISVSPGVANLGAVAVNGTGGETDTPGAAVTTVAEGELAVLGRALRIAGSSLPAASSTVMVPMTGVARAC